ncbi:CHAD domain-containing protein [Bdellovibrio sp. HCB337]|uniref:CHAD domain-containing protein n=1 Tax=Bdellovibrio sp. HCB337 TaxID=3394358 RepID=UPI0039A6BEA2
MELLEEHLSDQIKIFNRHLKTQTHQLSTEGVHQLRISTRRLRAVLSLLDESGYKISPDVSSSLKLLRQSLGGRRQWDVALKGAKKYHLKEERLRKKQATAGILLKDAIMNSDVQKLPKSLQALDRSLKSKKIQVKKTSLQKMRKNLKHWLSHKKLNVHEMHELRIATKKIRYAFEALDLPTEKLEELQDHLGKSHDLLILCEYFDTPKSVKRDEKRERKKAKKQIRPALRSSLDVLESLR